MNTSHERPKSAATVGGHPVLPGPGFGDQAALAHPNRQQPLAERVVDLVGAGVEEVFPLEVDADAAERAAQPFGVVEGGGPAGVRAEQLAKLQGEFRQLFLAK
jgi:hypothetical protein